MGLSVDVVGHGSGLYTRVLGVVEVGVCGLCLGRSGSLCVGSG